MFPDYKIGLSKPEGDEAPSFDKMRALISAGRRDSVVIAQCLCQAEFMGLGGEDKYVLLAYQALIQLEATHKRLMQMVSLTPGPITFEMPSGNIPPDLRRGTGEQS